MKHFSKILKPVLLFLLLVNLLGAQTTLNGSITYISHENAYMDLGKKAGLQVGDSVRVERGSTLLGIAIISQLSGSSSALTAIDPTSMTWQIGDLVKVQGPEPVEILEPVLNISDTSITVQKPGQVFLDSSAYEARVPITMDLGQDRFAPSFTGYISTRIDDRGGDPDAPRTTTGSLYGQFNVLDIGIQHLDASIFLRSSRSSTDSTSDTKLYSLMFSYNNPDNRFSYLLGRLYHPQFSSLGTVEGLGVSWSSDKRVIALVAGQESNLYNTIDKVNRGKFGLLNESHFKRGNYQIGTVVETESNELARSYLLLKSTLRLNKGLRIQNYGEFDLDIFDQSISQSLISLSRFRSSFNWRMTSRLSSSSRYSYRQNIFDLLDTADTEYDIAARHSFNSSLRWSSRSGLMFSGQASYRTDGSGRSIQMYGLNFGDRSFTARDIDLNMGSTLMLSYLSEGGRSYARMSKQVLPWLRLDLYDELFYYRILGETTFRIRHLPEISLAAKVPGLNRLRLRMRFEQEDGVTFYRLSFSASRQF